MIFGNCTSQTSNGSVINPFCDVALTQQAFNRRRVVNPTNPVLGEMPGPRPVLIGPQHCVAAHSSRDVHDRFSNFRALRATPAGR